MPKAHANGIRIHYETHGSGEPPYLTILGGLGDSSRNWGIIAREFGKKFTVLVPDTRGSGQSESGTAPYSIELFTRDIVAFWDTVGIDKSHVLGFSMGGMTAQYLASHFPQYLDKLILVSTSAGKKRFGPPDPKIMQFMSDYDLSEAHFAKSYEILLSEKFRKNFDEKMFVKFKLTDPHPQSRESFQAQFEAVKNFDSETYLTKIKSPTLIIAGDADALIAPNAAPYLKDHIPNAKLLIYEGCGHIPQMEEAQRFYGDVFEFLN